MNESPATVRKIAVVGGGIAGLAAAWSLSRRHDVTIYDRNSYLGGHANTVEVADAGARLAIDTGFIVYNEPSYPDLVALFENLGVVTALSEMSFAVSIGDGRLEYAGTDLNGLFAQRRNILNPRFWRMLRDIRRFYAAATGYLESCEPCLTIGDLLTREAYSDAFVDDHLVPMAAAIWSASQNDIRDYPAHAFIRFFDNHGLLKIHGRPPWRTVVGGSRAYVTRLIERGGFSCRRLSDIKRIKRDARGVSLIDERGDPERYDELVIATHADEALAMLADPSDRERAVLGTFRYSENTAWLHEDVSLMPQRRAAWSSWNFLHSDRSDTDTPLCVSYWMNRLQPLATARDFFVTLNPEVEPRDDSTHGRFAYTHPIFDAATTAQQSQSVELQGHSHTWFCGAYLGAGFHEDALQSGLWVAEQLDCNRPWNDSGIFTRLPASYAVTPAVAMSLSA